MTLSLADCDLTPEEWKLVNRNVGISKEATVNGVRGMIVIDPNDGAFFHGGAFVKPEHFRVIELQPDQSRGFVEGWKSFEACGRRQDNPFLHDPRYRVEGEAFYEGWDARAELSPPSAPAWIDELHEGLSP